MKDEYGGYLAEFKLFLKDEKNLSTNSISSYIRDVKIFIAYMSESSISDFDNVSDISVNGFIRSMESKSYKKSTISRRLSSIKLFFRFLINKGVASSYVFDNINNPKIEKLEPQYLSVEEVSEFLSVVSDDTIKGKRDKAILNLLYASGMKVSEIINLKVDDFNFDYGFIRCVAASRERIIPLVDIAKLSIGNYLSEARSKIDKFDSEFLFLNMSGKHLSRQGFWKIIKHYTKLAGIEKDVNPKILRHSFAKHLLENGADIKSVQQLLGHSNLASTQMYISKDDKKLMDVYLNSHPLNKKVKTDNKIMKPL